MKKTKYGKLRNIKFWANLDYIMILYTDVHSMCSSKYCHASGEKYIKYTLALVFVPKCGFQIHTVYTAAYICGLDSRKNALQMAFNCLIYKMILVVQFTSYIISITFCVLYLVLWTYCQKLCYQRFLEFPLAHKTLA